MSYVSLTLLLGSWLEWQIACRILSWAHLVSFHSSKAYWRTWVNTTDILLLYIPLNYSMAVNISKLAYHCLKYFQNDKIYVVLSFLSALECCKETKCFQLYKALQEKLRYLIIHIGNMYYIERFFVGEEQKRAADVTEQVPLLCLNHHHHFSQRPCQGI